MTTQPTNHRADQYRADAEYCLRQANIHIQEGDVAAHTQTGILAALCGIYDLLAEIRDEDGERPAEDTAPHARFHSLTDAEEIELREQYRLHPPTGKPPFQTVEQPSETDDTVETPRPYGLAHIDDQSAGVGSVGEIASRFGAISPRDDRRGGAA